MQTEFLHRCAVHSITAPPPPPSIQKHTVLPEFSCEPIKTQASTVRHVSKGPKKHEPMRIAPTRCLSPSTSSRLDRSEAGKPLPDGDTRISINRASLREISLNNSGLQKVSLFTCLSVFVFQRGLIKSNLHKHMYTKEDILKMFCSFVIQ